MPAAPIAFNVHLEMGEVFRALFLWNLKKFWFITVVAPVCVLLTLAMGSGPEDNVPAGALAFAVVWGSITFGIPYAGAWAFRKTGDIHYTFSEAGIDLAAKHSNGHVDWVLITRVQETASCLVLTVSKRMLYLIPKKVVTMPDLAALKDLLRTSVSGKVKLK